MASVRPDFEGGGLPNLMATLERGLGGRSDYVPLSSGLDVAAVAAARRVVLLLIDGLGDGVLQRRAPWLAQHRRRALTSVFPSATAPAITTVLTGVPPARHAVLAWFMHMRELDRVMIFLPFRPRVGGPVGATPAQVVGAGPLFDRIDVDSVVVEPKAIVDSAVSRALCGRARRVPHTGLADCMAQIAREVRAPGERRYVYAYWGELDTRAHQHGTEAAPTLEHLGQLERAVERLAAELAGTGTLLLVTADHGFIDVAGVDRLSMHPELAACLSQPLCGEPPAAFCHVKPGCEAQLRDYVAARLADRFELLEPERLIADGVLGPGPVDARLRARLGDFVLLGRDGHVMVDAVAGEAAWANTGVHGGMSEAEMRIPLVALDC